MVASKHFFFSLANVTARGGQVAGLWLGATNLPGCRSPSCGPFNTFQWTDGFTTGVGGLKWGVGEPDGNNWPGPTACIQQFIISPNFVAGANEFAGWKGAFVNGDLDKYTCVSPAYPYTRMYACGKVGVRR
ncbi:CRE-CLEC-233 protein [Caenorhabditis remanei]|uniref:CRE-CLEC-233 protein n=1 Tax=Caenorhabditis remanei TaxID=31234 RepID=E3MZ54_CAERE|nr:CRE-CLEC-233 protein [Caenorhabditis remanei]